MFDYINFIPYKGQNNKNKLKLLALSTCGFCKRAKNFLEENQIEFGMLYLDEIEDGIKSQMKKDFKEKFETRLSFPTLVINDEDFLTGFIEPAWKLKLLDA